MHPFWVGLIVFESIYCLITTFALLKNKNSSKMNFNKQLTSSEVILQKHLKDREFVQKCFKEDYDVFVKFYTETSKTDYHRPLYKQKPKNEKHIDNDRLFALFEQEEYVTLYKEGYQKLGWFIQTKFSGTHEMYDYRLVLKISPEPFPEDK